jgi:hypothetical protein
MSSHNRLISRKNNVRTQEKLRKFTEKVKMGTSEDPKHNIQRIKLFLHQTHYLKITAYLLLLSLAQQPSLGLGLLHKIWLNFLEASQQFSFLQGRVVSPTPNPHPRGPGPCIYIPQR